MSGRILSVLLAASAAVLARPGTTVQSSTSSTSTATTTVPTAVPSPTAPSDTPLPPQAALPPKQAWCPSEIFCAGALLQSLDLAQLFPDSKTVVDKPTKRTSKETLDDFNALAKGNVTIGDIEAFVLKDFVGEGLELQGTTLHNFPQAPAFLKNVANPLVKAFAQAVHNFWPLLIRTTDPAALCTEGKCESSLIPLNHTFVVPGGRFREQYYWDSYFIVEGLLESELNDVAKSTLMNFMDELERFGFIPNGGRIYYLNRSQPPLFIRMLHLYVQKTGDVSILDRALPLAETELKWWADNRTIKVKSPFTGATHYVARYAVNNSAPRPESYLEDYQAANGAGAGADAPNYTDAQKADLYAELASGAETGWDYSSRWIKAPSLADPSMDAAALEALNLKNVRGLNVRGTIPVDLNSILYNARISLAELYERQHHLRVAKWHRRLAARLRGAILDLFWDSTRLAFYDFNTTSNERNNELWTPATFYPLWSGIIPAEVEESEDCAFGFFAGLNMILNKYNGTIPTTFLNTGLQWDWPNAWPPHQHIALEALRALPLSVTKRPLPEPPSSGTTFDLVPKGQLGITAAQLPPQTGEAGAVFPVGADVNRLNGTVINGGAAIPGEGWTKALIRELSNRYTTSVLCSWRATGGSIPGVLPRLSGAQLAVTNSQNNTGQMFEKFSVLDVDSAGRGGEYTVQTGFGWSNGVLLAAAARAGKELGPPNCPDPALIAP